MEDSRDDSQADGDFDDLMNVKPDAEAEGPSESSRGRRVRDDRSASGSRSSSRSSSRDSRSRSRSRSQSPERRENKVTAYKKSVSLVKGASKQEPLSADEMWERLQEQSVSLVPKKAKKFKNSRESKKEEYPSMVVKVGGMKCYMEINGTMKPRDQSDHSDKVFKMYMINEGKEGATLLKIAKFLEEAISPIMSKKYSKLQMLMGTYLGDVANATIVSEGRGKSKGVAESDTIWTNGVLFPYDCQSFRNRDATCNIFKIVKGKKVSATSEELSSYSGAVRTVATIGNLVDYDQKNPGLVHLKYTFEEVVLLEEVDAAPKVDKLSGPLRNFTRDREKGDALERLLKVLSDMTITEIDSITSNIAKNRSKPRERERERDYDRKDHRDTRDRDRDRKDHRDNRDRDRDRRR